MSPVVIRALPSPATFEDVKTEARRLLGAARSGDVEAIARIHVSHPPTPGERLSLTLALAELTIAREYGFSSADALKVYIRAVTAPASTELYVRDPTWYEARALGLVVMHAGRLPNALAQIRTWHPRFRSAGDADIAESPFALDDARLVYARQHGAASWSDLMARVERLARTGGSAFADAFAAIERGDAAGLDRLLSQHHALGRQAGTNGNTLLNLAVAIERRHGPLVETLLAAGADPNAPNNRGWTPLHAAAASEDAVLVSRLLDAGASVAVSAHGDGGTPLAVALAGNHMSAARRLAGVAVVPDNLRVNAALDLAERLYGFFDVNTRTVDTGVGRAFYRSHSGFPTWTPSNEAREIVDEALMWAARTSAIRSMAVLVEHGADINRSPYRGTPLMFAAYFQHVDAARWLIEHGADVNRLAVFHGGEPGRVTALHLAAQTNNTALVKLLLEAGADRTITDENYQSDAAGWARYTRSQRTLEILNDR